MFLDNKYYKWYKELTSKTDRELDCYTEKHHIIPRSMGGLDTKENLVVLTAREHYIAHLLLTKCVTKEFYGKMSSAYVMMATTKDKNQKRIFNINSKLFEVRKVESINHKKEFKHSEEAKKNISKNLKGIPKQPFTDEHRNNISKGHMGQKAWNKGLVGTHKSSDKQKQAVSESSAGIVVCFDKETLINTRVLKDIYHSNKSRYISHSSKEYKTKYKGVVNVK